MMNTEAKNNIAVPAEAGIQSFRFHQFRTAGTVGLVLF